MWGDGRRERGEAPPTPRRVLGIGPVAARGLLPSPFSPLPEDRKFGDKLTDELVNCLNSIETGYRGELRDLFHAHFGRFEETLEHRLAETTAELRTELRDEIARSRAGVHDEIAGLRTETGDRIGGRRSEIRDQMASLRVEVHAVKGDLMKWSFVFWLPVVLALVGLYVKG